MFRAPQRSDAALNSLSTVLKVLKKCKGPRDFYCETIVVCCKLCSITLTARRDHALKKKICKALLKIAKQSRHEKPYPPNITQLAAETLVQLCAGYEADWTRKFRKRVKKARSKCSKEVRRALRCVLDGKALKTAKPDKTDMSSQRSRSHSQHSKHEQQARRRTHYEPSPTRRVHSEPAPKRHSHARERTRSPSQHSKHDKQAHRRTHYEPSPSSTARRADNEQPSGDRKSHYEPVPRRHARTYYERSRSPSRCSDYGRLAQRRTHYAPSPHTRRSDHYGLASRRRSPSPSIRGRPQSRTHSRSRSRDKEQQQQQRQRRSQSSRRRSRSWSRSNRGGRERPAEQSDAPSIAVTVRAVTPIALTKESKLEATVQTTSSSSSVLRRRATAAALQSAYSGNNSAAKSGTTSSATGSMDAAAGTESAAAVADTPDSSTLNRSSQQCPMTQLEVMHDAFAALATAATVDVDSSSAESSFDYHKRANRSGTPQHTGITDGATDMYADVLSGQQCTMQSVEQERPKCMKTSEFDVQQPALEAAQDDRLLCIRILNVDCDELQEMIMSALQAVGNFELMGRCYWQCLLDLRFSEPLDADAVPDIIDDLELVSYSNQKPLVVLKKPCNFYRGQYYKQYCAPYNSAYTNTYYILQNSQSIVRSTAEAAAHYTDAACLLTGACAHCNYNYNTRQTDATLKLPEAEVVEAYTNNTVQLRIVNVDSDEVRLNSCCVGVLYVFTAVFNVSAYVLKLTFVAKLLLRSDSSAMTPHMRFTM
eukprot:7562-Heterococcus_DN1.PRE.2